MAVLRYFHQDPRQTSVQESSVIDKQGTVLTQKLTTINQSITNNTQVLEDKLNSVPGKSLSTNDFTDEYKNKLRGIEEGAEVNVQSDWGEDDNTADSYIKNKPVIDNIVTQNSENLITSGAVFTAIDELPEPMIFKGSLGVGGTIQTLPAPSADNVGFVYKVITAGTYYGITAKPGDSFISDSSDWILIPSGDEPEGTVMSVGLTVPTGLLVSGSPITTSGTLAITYALGYAIPTTAKLDEWDAKQNAISDLSTIRTNASNGNTAYGWGNHANAGYLAAISDLATIRSNASEGHTAYGWGNHANAGYVKSSGVTSVAMTVPTGLAISGSPITSTGTLALSFANGYSIPTTTKQGNWDTAYGWGNHASAGYLKSITKAMVTTALGYTPPLQDTNTWRGILNNLTSDSTTDSLSAAQGKALANGSARDSTKLPLAGGTMTGNISFSNNTGISAIMGGGTDNWGIIGTGTGDAGRLKIYVGDNGVSDWMDFEFRDYTGTTYTPLSMTGNSVQFTVNPTVNGNSIWHAGNLTNLNLLTNGPGYITSSSLGSYLPLTGGTLSNGNWGLQLTLKRQGGTPSLYFNDGTYSYYFYPTMSKDNEWHVGLTYNNKDYTLWHNGNFNPANYLPLTGGTLSGDLNVRNSKIWIQSNSEAGSNSNRLTTSAGMPGNMQYNTSRRGTQIYSNGIAFADPYNGNSNNDAAWIRHLETTGNAGLLEIAVGDDASNEEIRFRRYNTSNNIASDVLVPNTTGTLALTSQIPTNLNQLTNGPGYITGITKTMVTNALGYTPPTADTNTWRGITDSYSGTDSSISLSQKGGKALYDALVNGLAGTVYQTYSNGSSNYRVLLGYPDSNNGYKNVYKNNFFYANPNVKKVYIDGSLYFTNTGNSSGGWNIYSQGVGLRILDDTGSSDRGAPSNYYATGLHVGGQYWFLLAFERGDNRLLYRGGNAEGVTRDWTRIPIYGDDEYACRGKMWIQCDTYDSSVIIGALEKEDTTQGPFVGIGKVDPSYKLHVNGACGATSHPTTSDIRIKDIQSDISINLEDIANAPLFLFKWKEGGDNLTHVGTSALYWKEKVPELVSEANDERKTLSLEYEVLGTAGSIAIAKEVVSLKEEIKLLQALIAELKLLLNN